MPNDDDPPIRLILAALFTAARLVGGGSMPTTMPELVSENLRLADELLRQAGPPP
jgi:hypothetical protein